MMEMIDFSSFSQNDRVYGGASGAKIGIVYQGENYLLKFPGATKDSKGKPLKNVRLSYSNSPVCEYLGSHIYRSIGIPVHETLLGERKGKVVVACKDFLKTGDYLDEFNKIKTTFEAPQAENISDGFGAELTDVLQVLDRHPVLKKTPGVKERFWEMFIVDAFIGNGDRNNGNWGVIRHEGKSTVLAPVYDNGGCLNNKWDEIKMQQCLSDPKWMVAQAYDGVTCNYEKNGRRINPFHFLQTTDNPDCLLALQKIAPKLRDQQYTFEKLFDSVPVLSDTQRKFYRIMLRVRLEQALIPMLKKAFSRSR